MPTPTELQILLRYRVTFERGSTPDRSRFVFAGPRGNVEATAAQAVGPLSGGIRALNAHASVRAWATPAILAQRLVAAGRLSSPSSTERQQLMDAGAAIGPTATEGQSSVQAFLDALAIAQEPAATPPPDRSESRPVARPDAYRSDAPRTFVHRLVAEFLEVSGDLPDDQPVATVELRVKPLDRRWGEVPGAELWSRPDHHFGPHAKDSVTSMLQRLSITWPPAARFLADPAHSSTVQVTRDELGLLGSGPVSVALMANRTQVSWPSGLRRDITARAVIRSTDATTERHSGRTPLFSRDSLFRVDWTVSVAGRTLDRDELRTLLDSPTGLTRVGDDWVYVEPQQLSRLAEEQGRDIGAIDALRAAVTGTWRQGDRVTEVDTVGWLEDLRRRLAERADVTVEQPHGLVGQLREYQLAGLRWMAQLVDLGLGGILADDMGLGKTLMLISLHLHLNASTPTLVICPASVMSTWEREVERFAPGVPVRRFHGAGRHLEGVKEGFVVTTYATMLSSVEALRDVDWALVVADEAQHVKNAQSKAAEALRTIESGARMALTGTPVENSLTELWAILDWAAPGLLGTRDQFRREWSLPIERDLDDQRARELSQLIRPFVLRRRKIDPGIAPELPPKIETDHRIQLTDEQRRLYEAVVRGSLGEIERSSGIARRGLVIRLITQLKQICNHPAQFLHAPEQRLVGRSGKLAELDDLLGEIIAENGAALVFTQYASMGDLLSKHLSTNGVDHFYLHGSTPVRSREQMVNDFQAGQVPVFVLSLRAAGTGLNLTRADHVIHFDRWWNPAVEDQATDRAHRIGQLKPVQVHRLIAEGTVEESIAELIAAKRDLADAVVNSGAGALTELSDTELAQLVRLRADR